MARAGLYPPGEVHSGTQIEGRFVVDLVTLKSTAAYFRAIPGAKVCMPSLLIALDECTAFNCFSRVYSRDVPILRFSHLTHSFDRGQIEGGTNSSIVY